MIDWKKSAELNDMPVKELKAYFRRHPKSYKKVVDVCNICSKERSVEFRYSNRLCTSCVQKGKHHTDESKRKASVANMGHEMSPEAKRKMSQSRTGKTYPHKGIARTDTTKRKISSTLQGIPYDEWDGFSEGDWREWDKAVYLNEPFPGCHRHHLTQTIVACIPDELHRHIKHILKTGHNMGEMNMLALQFIHGCYDDGQRQLEMR